MATSFTKSIETYLKYMLVIRLAHSVGTLNSMLLDGSCALRLCSRCYTFDSADRNWQMRKNENVLIILRVLDLHSKLSTLYSVDRKQK